jgi:hypothetical protein
MACDSVITSNIVWSKNTDPTMLEESLKEAGYFTATGCGYINFRNGITGIDGSYNLETHRMTIRNGSEATEAEIKQGYGKQVATVQMKKFGWQYEWSTAPNGNPIATVKRRA